MMNPSKLTNASPSVRKRKGKKKTKDTRNHPFCGFINILSILWIYNNAFSSLNSKNILRFSILFPLSLSFFPFNLMHEQWTLNLIKWHDPFSRPPLKNARFNFYQRGEKHKVVGWRSELCFFVAFNFNCIKIMDPLWCHVLTSVTS